MIGEVGRRIMRDEYKRWGERPREKNRQFSFNSIGVGNINGRPSTSEQILQSKRIIRKDSPSIENGEKQIAKTTLINR